VNAFARWLFALARRVMPSQRREWWAAMRAEADYLSAAGAVRWACGCLFTACRERLPAMDTREFRISRWVMIVEAIGCFGPLSLAWCLTTFGASGLLRYTPDIVARDFAAIPGGTFIFTLFALGAVVGLVGPIGLYLGMRYAASGRGLARPFGFTLIGVLVAYQLVAALGWLIGPPGYRPDATTALLFVLIPLLGLAHLIFLARPVRPLRGAGLAAS
jgi:hypothetical protein